MARLKSKDRKTWPQWLIVLTSAIAGFLVAVFVHWLFNL